MGVYNKENTEPFARNVIGHSYDKSYLAFRRTEDGHGFDLLSEDGSVALEVTILLNRNDQAAIAYEKALHEGKHPDSSRVKGSAIDETGELLWYQGEGMGDISNAILNAITRKNIKAINNGALQKKATDLCLILGNDSGLLHKDTDYDFVPSSDEFQNSVFRKVFIVAREKLFVIDREGVTECPKVFAKYED